MVNVTVSEDTINAFLNNLKELEFNAKNGIFPKEDDVFQFYSALLPPLNFLSLKNAVDQPYSTTTFSHQIPLSLHYLTLLSTFLNKIMELENNKGIFLSNKIKDKVIVKGLIFASQFYNSEFSWSNVSCSTVSCHVISILMKFSHSLHIHNLCIENKCTNEAQYACAHISKESVLLKLLQELADIFNKNTWKKNISYINSIFWIIGILKAPHLSKYMGYLLPPALFMLDDWEIRHKVHGANILKHIIQNSAASELRWYGRAEVVYQALFHELYSREAELLLAIYPVIILAAIVLETNPTLVSSLAKSSYDEIMERLMCEMSFEQQLDRREIYAKALKQLVNAMGFMVMRWSKDLMDIFSNYLETYEGPDAQDRIEIIETLEMHTKHCWPRIHIHAVNIIKMLLKLIFTLGEDDCPIKEEARQILLEKAKFIIELVDEGAPDVILGLLNDTDEICFKSCNGSKDLKYVLSGVREGSVENLINKS